MHKGSHQERRSLCSGSQCGQCGSSSACSWPGSTPKSKECEDYLTLFGVHTPPYKGKWVVHSINWKFSSLMSGNTCHVFLNHWAKKPLKSQLQIKKLKTHLPHLLKLSSITTYLDHLVPAAGDNDGVAAVGGEAHARHPLRMALILQSEVVQPDKNQ